MVKRKAKQKAEQRPVPVPLTPLLDIQGVCELLNLGRTKVFQLISDEGLPVQRFGSAIRVDPIELRHWLEQRQQRSA